MTQDHLPFDTPKPPDHPLVDLMGQIPEVLEYALGVCGVGPRDRQKTAKALLQGKVTLELKRAAETYRKVVL